jgi:lipopolysaccharide/colanic/teichoic acid biosynthesis glycosyltransferase
MTVNDRSIELNIRRREGIHEAHGALWKVGAGLAKFTSYMIVRGVLILGDVLALLVSYCLLLQIDATDSGETQLQRAMVAASIVCLVGFWGASLYPGYRLHQYEHLRRRVMIVLGVATVAVFTSGVILGEWTTAWQVAAFVTVALCIQPILYAAARWCVWRTGFWGEEAALVATPDLANILTGYFEMNWQYGVNLSVHHPGSPQTFSAPGEVGEEKHVKPRVALVAVSGQLQWDNMAELRWRYPEIILLADLPHIRISGLQPCDVGGYIGLRVVNRAAYASYLPTRRILDLVVASVGLLLLSPLMLLCALAIWLVDPGNVIYRQAREGRKGHIVHVLKLRTMYRDAEHRLTTLLNQDEDAHKEWHKYYKLKNDPRILPIIGNVLRRTSCDELPQLFNVIAGEMSIVGPRPFPEYHLAAMPADFRAKRRTVMPGLTGLWQISDRSNATIDVQQQLDDYYINNRSFWFDLYIIIKTIPSVIRGSGAY